MEKFIMYGTILATIIVCIIGIIKFPLIKYKKSNWFKPVIMATTLVLTAGSISIFYFFIMKISTIELITLTLSTFASIYAEYNLIYEGFNVKELVKIIVGKIKEIKSIDPKSKFSKIVDKFDKSIPIEQMIALLFEKQENKVVINNNEEQEAIEQTIEQEATL
ncbi:MAG: hypothetical protein RSA24_03105 [Clostridia bacterium]